MRAASKEVHVTSERKERRGFASMSPERQKEIASKGGQVSRGGRGRLVDNNEENTPPSDDNLGMA